MKYFTFVFIAVAIFGLSLALPMEGEMKQTDLIEAQEDLLRRVSELAADDEKILGGCLRCVPKVVTSINKCLKHTDDKAFLQCVQQLLGLAAGCKPCVCSILRSLGYFVC